MVHHVQYSTAPKPEFGVDGFDSYSYDMKTDLFAVAIGRSVQMIGGDRGESIVLTLYPRCYGGVMISASTMAIHDR